MATRGELLARAEDLLVAASGATTAEERFSLAYLSALRAAGAIIAAGRPPRVGRSGSRSAWVLLVKAAPEQASWAEYFSGHSALRARMLSGMSADVTDVMADELLARADAFLTLAQGSPRVLAA